MRNKAFFNSKAQSWDSQVIHDMRKIEEIIDLIDIREGDQILDVGTGTGVIIPTLQSRVGVHGKITAIDEAEKMIEVAQSKFNDANIEFVVGDVLKSEFQGNKFDCIICYSMFPHFDDKKIAIATLAKLLKKNGKLVICHSQSRDAINNLHGEISGSVQNDRLPSMVDLNQMFKAAQIDVTVEVDNEELFIIMGTR